MQKIYFFKKIPAINASFAPKYVHLRGWSLESRKNIKDEVVPAKILKLYARTNSR